MPFHKNHVFRQWTLNSQLKHLLDDQVDDFRILTVLEPLLEKGANINTRNKMGDHAFGVMVKKNGNVGWMLDKYKVDWSAQNKRGDSLMHILAIYYGLDKWDLCVKGLKLFVKEMTEQKKSVDIVNKNGETPFSNLCSKISYLNEAYYNNKPIPLDFFKKQLTLLLEAGANINHPTDKGLTPIKLLCTLKWGNPDEHLDLLSWMVERGALWDEPCAPSQKIEVMCRASNNLQVAEFWENYRVSQSQLKTLQNDMEQKLPVISSTEEKVGIKPRNKML